MTRAFSTQASHVPQNRVVVLRAMYNEHVTSKLVEGALATLKARGISEDKIDVIEVPGAYELTSAAAHCAAAIDVDCVIALGAVIRGETPHFDFICQSVAQGLARVAESSLIPVTFGVITSNTVEQAFERAGGRAGNKGEEAAKAALDLYSVLKQWEQHIASGS